LLRSRILALGVCSEWAVLGGMTGSFYFFVVNCDWVFAMIRRFLFLSFPFLASGAGVGGTVFDVTYPHIRRRGQGGYMDAYHTSVNRTQGETDPSLDR